jgi:hypothetical protein
MIDDASFGADLGEGIICEVCGETFPSTQAASEHFNHAHGETDPTTD